jgi:hypothetical protein
MAIHGTNIGNELNLKHLLDGIVKNTSLETLNLSDNDLRDENGIHFLKFMKMICEKRDDDLWKKSLRNSVIEDQLRYRVNLLNGRELNPDRQRQINSKENEEYVRLILKNLTSTDMMTHNAVIRN